MKKNKLKRNKYIGEGRVILNSDCKGKSEEYDNDEIFFVKPKHISLLKEDCISQ